MRKKMLDFSNKIKLSIAPSIACIQQPNTRGPEKLPTLTKKIIEKRKLSINKTKENQRQRQKSSQKMFKTFTSLPKKSVKITRQHFSRLNSNNIIPSKCQQEGKNQSGFISQKSSISHKISQIMESLINQSAISKTYLTNYTVKKKVLANILHDLAVFSVDIHAKSSQLSHQHTQYHLINEKLLQLGLVLSDLRFQGKKQKLQFSPSFIYSSFTHANYAEAIVNQSKELQQLLNKKQDLIRTIKKLEERIGGLTSLNNDKEAQMQAYARQININISIIELKSLKIQQIKEEQLALLQNLEAIKAELSKIDSFSCQNQQSILLASDEHKKCEKYLYEYSDNLVCNEQQEQIPSEIDRIVNSIKNQMRVINLDLCNIERSAYYTHQKCGYIQNLVFQWMRLISKQVMQGNSDYIIPKKKDKKLILLLKSWADSWTQKNQFMLGLKRELIFHQVNIKKYLNILKSKLESQNSLKQLSVVLSIKECLQKLQQSNNFIQLFN